MRIALALVLAGCGSKQADAPAPKAEPAVVAPSDAARVAKGGDPEEGGELAAAPAAKPVAGPADAAPQQVAVLGSEGAGAPGRVLTNGTVGTNQGIGGGGAGGMRGRPVVTPQVKLGTATVTGQLDAAIVTRYMRRNLSRFQFCYERVLQKNPGLAGHVVVTYTIDTDGKVITEHAKAFDADLGSCVEQAVGGIEFPKPKSGTVSVSYPIDFKQQ